MCLVRAGGWGRQQRAREGWRAQGRKGQQWPSECLHLQEARAAWGGQTPSARHGGQRLDGEPLSREKRENKRLSELPWGGTGLSRRDDGGTFERTVGEGVLSPSGRADRGRVGRWQLLPTEPRGRGSASFAAWWHSGCSSKLGLMRAVRLLPSPLAEIGAHEPYVLRTPALVAGSGSRGNPVDAAPGQPPPHPGWGGPGSSPSCLRRALILSD